ncbi:3D domain-containing protein [Winogradskyella sp. SM1960]|uniref:3D domain-containing protein n=1 Tax=Winogradskyella sp. SM1960 TaxID=2865955 RepID=UPI001CD7476D|nr:3D domain-containing protein [Winogradskyella sp. SM1960]
MKIHHFVIILCCLSLYNCNTRAEDKCITNTILVTATAYNSLAYQTNSNPNITAFGDSLKPGLRYIAVSRDLLDSGLVHNTKVKIQGFDSLYTVKDKMNRRWRKRIDIYMDNDVNKAKNWGKKKVKIEYCIQSNDSISNENV